MDRLNDQTDSHLIIAIDFGTTFTGVAYYLAPPPPPPGAGSPLDAQQIVENITIVTNWPSAGPERSGFKEKTPTVIAYNSEPPRWGRQVRPRDDQQEAYFKLYLEPTAPGHYERGTSHQQGSGLRNRLQLLPASSGLRNRHLQLMPATRQVRDPVDIAADYLTCVYAHVRDGLFRERFGPDYLETLRTSFVITVPAIWSPLARDLTRTAVGTRAGISADTLSMVTEPEAAALYCATICEELELEAGDRFVVCDAGGGTVVLDELSVVV
jgi:molecular chaperone DnaK (HSP70)